MRKTLYFKFEADKSSIASIGLEGLIRILCVTTVNDIVGVNFDEERAPKNSSIKKCAHNSNNEKGHVRCRHAFKNRIKLPPNIT